MEKEVSFIVGQSNECCSHKIWVYDGSYKILYDEHGHARQVVECCNNAIASNEFNEYMCLDCHKRIKEYDWQTFELLHSVIKNRNNLESYKYKKDYHELLIDHSETEEQDMLAGGFKRLVLKKYSKNMK